MKNMVLRVIFLVLLVAFGVCGYILWRWGNPGGYGVVVLLDGPIVIGILLRLRNDSVSWRQRSVVIPDGDPLQARTNELEAKMGVPHHDLYIADPALMAKKRAYGAATTGIRKHAIFFTDYFLKELTPEEQSAIIAHELAHTKQTHALTRFVASMGFYFAGLNLLLFSAIPNFDDPNISKFWTNRIASFGIIMFVIGIFAVGPYLSASSQIEADEISVKTIGNGDSLISGMKKLLEVPEVKGDQKRYRSAHRSIYDRIVRIQTLSRSLSSRNTSQENVGKGPDNT